MYVNWTLTSGTATADTDFKGAPKPKKTKIRAGKTNAQATITAYGDLGVEADETFTVTITSLTIVGTRQRRRPAQFRDGHDRRRRRPAHRAGRTHQRGCQPARR